MGFRFAVVSTFSAVALFGLTALSCDRNQSQASHSSTQHERPLLAQVGQGQMGNFPGQVGAGGGTATNTPAPGRTGGGTGSGTTIPSPDGGMGQR